jgi:hypothetical protein
MMQRNPKLGRLRFPTCPLGQLRIGLPRARDRDSRPGILEDCAGGVAISVALIFLVLLGFAALGTDIVFALYKSNQMQSAADSAAVSAATARMRGYPADYVLEGRAVAATSGFVAGEEGTSVAIELPPTHGNFDGRSDALEVIISQPQALPIVGLFRRSPFVVSARAVAIVGGSGKICALSLEGAAAGAVRAGGSTNTNLVDCGLAVNSSAAEAVTLSGSAVIATLETKIVGDYALSGNAVLSATNGIVTASGPTVDPYASVAVPPIGSCTRSNYKATGGKVETLSPGVYCNGMSISGGSTITLNPGVYVIDRGSLSISGNSGLTGDGVTIVLTSSTGSNFATVSLSGGTRLDLTAPPTGPTAGLAFFQDRRAPTSGSNSFTGGTTQVVNGALYFPRQSITFAGGSDVKNQCTQLIGRTIDFSGNATLRLDCDGMGTSPVGTGTVRLVE